MSPEWAGALAFLIYTLIAITAGHLMFGPAPAPRGTVDGPNVRVGAVCEDGTWSSATGSGACSWHGGVDQWRYKQLSLPSATDSSGADGFPRIKLMVVLLGLGAGGFMAFGYYEDSSSRTAKWERAHREWAATTD